MITHYVLAFTLAMLSIIAVEDLKVSRFVDVTVSQSKLMQNKISRNIRKLRASWYVHKKKVKRT